LSFGGNISWISDWQNRVWREHFCYAKIPSHVVSKEQILFKFQKKKCKSKIMLMTIQQGIPLILKEEVIVLK